MSFDFHLFRRRGEHDPGAPLEWEKDEAAPIGRADEVRDALARDFGVRWEEGAPLPMGRSIDRVYGAEYRIALLVDGEHVSMIWPDNRASPTTIVALMQRFALTDCYTEHGERRDPANVDDDWRPRG